MLFHSHDHKHGQTNAPNRILAMMRKWEIAPSDIIRAIDTGARNPNAKNSKSFRAMAVVGGARLKPYDGDWMICPARSASGQELGHMIDHARKVAVRLVRIQRNGAS